MKSYGLLAAVAFLIAVSGCAGEGGSIIKVGLGSWNCTMGGRMTAEDSSGIGGTIKLDNSSDFNLDLTEQIPRLELGVGTNVRMRLGMWQGQWSGRNTDGATFAFLGVTFMNESISTDISVKTYDFAMEFCLVPLVDVIPEANIRGYAGFGIKYLQMGLDIQGEMSGNVSETLPAPTPFVMLGIEAEAAKYFTAFFRMDICKLAFGYSDMDVDLASTELKAGVGAFYRFWPDAKGSSGPSVGLELGVLNDRLNLEIVQGKDSSSEQNFDFHMGFNGMFFQAVFSF